MLVLLTVLLAGSDRLPSLGVDALSAATRPGQAVVGSVASDYQLLEQRQPRTVQLDDAGAETAPLNAILAGDDPCAVDAVGAQLLGATPAQVPGLLLAGEHLLGKVEWAEIKLNGAPVPGVPQGAQPFEGPAGLPRSQQ